MTTIKAPPPPVELTRPVTPVTIPTSTTLVSSKWKNQSDWCRLYPCAKCPFRATYQGPHDFLQPGRRSEIMEVALGKGGDFYCHETLTEDSETGELVSGPNSRVCAGFALSLLRSNFDTQGMRIAERLGAFDPAEHLERNQYVKIWTFDQISEDALKVEDLAICNTCDPGCLAPAGHMVSGVAMPNVTDEADDVCADCGEPVCSNCISEDGQCGNCVSDPF